MQLSQLLVALGLCTAVTVALPTQEAAARAVEPDNAEVDAAFRWDWGAKKRDTAPYSDDAEVDAAFRWDWGAKKRDATPYGDDAEVDAAFRWDWGAKKRDTEAVNLAREAVPDAAEVDAAFRWDWGIKKRDNAN